MSTSKSSTASNPSIKNIMNSYRSHKPADSDFRFNNIKYKCDIIAPLQEAWREGTLDPGRRFFGCCNYKDPEKKCNFFLWADPSYTDRAREVIQGLKVKMRMRDAEMQKAMTELSFVERKMLVLNEECMSLRKKMDQAAAKIDEAAAIVKQKDCLRTRKLLCIVILVLFVFMFFK